MEATDSESRPVREDRLLGLLQAIDNLRLSEPMRIASEVADQLATAYCADLANVLVFREEIGSLEALGVSPTPMGRQQPALGLDRLPLVNGGYAARTFRTGAPQLTGRADRDPNELRGLVNGLGIRSVATAAIASEGARHGVLMVASAEPDAFQEQDVRALGVAAGWVGLLLDRSQLVAQLATAVERPDDAGAVGELARLTERQRSVVALIGEGLTNGQIARQLGLTEGTVANHMEQALRRLDLRNRAHLAVWACRFGLSRADGDGVGQTEVVKRLAVTRGGVEPRLSQIRRVV